MSAAAWEQVLPGGRLRARHPPLSRWVCLGLIAACLFLAPGGAAAAARGVKCSVGSYTFYPAVTSPGNNITLPGATPDLAPQSLAALCTDTPGCMGLTTISAPAPAR